MYLTGHSLGGALATLAAYDVARALQELPERKAEVACYTFGAPRVGNYAFARAYAAAVPDTWSIINDQARAPWPPLDLGFHGLWFSDYNACSLVCDLAADVSCSAPP